MSTHNIGFYEDLTKIIFELSSNTHLISSADKQKQYQILEFMQTVGASSENLFPFCFFWFLLRLNVQVNNFSVMSGWSHRFLGITSTFWEVNVSCSRIQHGDLSEDRTPDLSLRCPMLYH